MKMQEIELKAHVYDSEAVINKLSGFAEYAGFVNRYDTYYKQGEGKTYPIRIRKEKDDNSEKLFLTYKRKSIVKDEEGTAIEKNEEYESEIKEDTLVVIEKFFEDNGFRIYLTKEKKVKTWKTVKDGFRVTIELCEVEKLGEFLELEILAENDESEKAYSALESVLEEAGIEKSAVEEKSYAQMLKNASN